VLKTDHAHVHIETDINQALKLVGFITEKSRDHHLNRILNLNLSAYLESLLANEEGNLQLHSYRKHLENLVSHFEEKARKANHE
jgi:hypothetical protein